MPPDPAPVTAAFVDLRKDGATPRSVAAFEAVLDAFLQPPATDGADPADRHAARIARKRALADVLETTILPQLVRDVRDEAPSAADGSTRGARGQLITLAELLVRLRARIAPAGRGATTAAAWRALESDLTGRAAAFFEAAKGELDGDDHPDLGEIARHIQRLTILQWALETLGCAAPVRTVRQSSRIVGRLAIRRVTGIIDGFLDTRGLEGRIDVANVTVCVDDLTVIVTRILDGELEEREGEPERFVESVGTTVIAQFLSALRRLSLMLLGEARRSIDTDAGAARTLDGTLRQIGKIAGLCTTMRHPVASRGFADLRNEIRHRARHLGEEIVGLAAGQTDPRHARRLAGQARSIERFLSELDGSRRPVTGPD